jgi:hypothetical protein
METMMMLRVAALLFAVAAAGGLLMAGIRLFGNRNPPAALALLHGLLAASGLTLLIYPAIVVGVPQNALWALLLLAAAAGGGLVLNQLYHWKQLPLPKPLMYGHMLLAVIGLALLITVVV